MAKHNLLKKISLGIASLALICPLAMSGLNTNANASSRYYFNNVRHPHNPVERAFTRKGWTSGPMLDFTGAHITIHGRHYTVHGTSAVGGYLTLNGSRHHARRTHRVYRHRRRARKATRRRRGRRAKRTRKVRRSHRRVARKATRRPRITKAHKARKTHKHHVNNDSLLAAYEREAETDNTPTPVHHESQAQWYKNNGARLFRENINNNMIFKKGINDAGAGIGVPSSVPNLYQSNNNSNSTYKHGWIDGDVLGQDTTGPKIYAIGGSHYQQLKAVPKSYYKNALIDWNNGMNYLSTHPNASNIYLSGNGNGNNGYWVKSDN